MYIYILSVSVCVCPSVKQNVFSFNNISPLEKHVDREGKHNYRNALIILQHNNLATSCFFMIACFILIYTGLWYKPLAIPH